MQPTEHRDSPHDALIKALERVEEMGSVLIVWDGKDGAAAGSVDSSLSIMEALYLIELYKAWLMAATLGYLPEKL